MLFVLQKYRSTTQPCWKDNYIGQLHWSAYVPIGFSRIVRASLHQANDIFISGFAGIQCAAMVLTNIVRATIGRWNTLAINRNMIEGDSIHESTEYFEMKTLT